jgi:hypothetical protein
MRTRSSFRAAHVTHSLAFNSPSFPAAVSGPRLYALAHQSAHVPNPCGQLVGAVGATPLPAWGDTTPVVYMDNRRYPSTMCDRHVLFRRCPGVHWLHTVAAFVQVDRVEFVAGFPDTPSDPAVVVLNPDDEITPEAFAAWLDRRQAGEPVDPGVRAADTLAEARAAGEV